VRRSEPPGVDRRRGPGIADRLEAITDEIWPEVTSHCDHAQLMLGGLLIAMGAINGWSGFNVTIRTLAGSWSG
jgi:hypothetical protein